jgi:hypothetical protein
MFMQEVEREMQVKAATKAKGANGAAKAAPADRAKKDLMINKAQQVWWVAAMVFLA